MPNIKETLHKFKINKSIHLIKRMLDLSFNNKKLMN